MGLCRGDFLPCLSAIGAATVGRERRKDMRALTYSTESVIRRPPKEIFERYRRNLWMSPWHENAAYLPP